MVLILPRKMIKKNSFYINFPFNRKFTFFSFFEEIFENLSTMAMFLKSPFLNFLTIVVILATVYEYTNVATIYRMSTFLNHTTDILSNTELLLHSTDLALGRDVFGIVCAMIVLLFISVTISCLHVEPITGPNSYGKTIANVLSLILLMICIKEYMEGPSVYLKEYELVLCFLVGIINHV